MTCEPWPVSWPCPTEEVPPETLLAAQEFAASMLWGLTGRRLGVCTYVEGYWPVCGAACGAPAKGADGLWRNFVGQDCCRLYLHHAPVWTVVEVTELGETVGPSGYDIDRHRWLRRKGGCWTCTDECEDPPVFVSYTAGVPLPAGADLAVGEVACELLKGWAGEPCRLPSRAVSISRQGVTVNMADPSEYLTNGLLGMPISDAFIRMTNPNKLLQRSRVYSPDMARRA